MIRARNLSLRLGTREVLHGVSLDLAPGSITVIIGANGAGKSSLLRGLAGLLPPASGSLTIDDQPIAALPPRDRARRIGYLPQNGTPAWAITVRDLVALGRLPHRSPFAAPSPNDVLAIDQALADTDLLALADRPVDRLSGGELARAKFARVLAGQSDWILADEPLANLDPPHQRDVMALLRAAARAGKGVVVVLHQLNAVAELADQLVALKQGACLAAGPRTSTLTPETLAATFDMSFDLVPLNGRMAVLPAPLAART